MPQTSIYALFDLLDSWRHLPSYQLERRADLFFALYIPQALEEKLGFRIRPQLIPEFPARIGTIYPERSSNQSFKIDYLALSEDGRNAVFVELKTDISSRRLEQDAYLKAAQKAGLPKLLEGLLEIFRATTAKRKYFYLIEQLAALGQYHIPDSMREILLRSDLRGVTQASRSVTITTAVTDSVIIYIQPRGTGPGTISFEDLRKIVRQHNDPISARFADSLTKWAGNG